MTLPSRSHLNAYDKIDATHYAHASAGIQKLEVPFGFSTGEAGGLYQMWMRKGMVRQRECVYLLGRCMACHEDGQGGKERLSLGVVLFAC